MRNNLLLITGAGASYDVVGSDYRDANKNYTPPLTESLFARLTANQSEVLNKHPNADHLGKRYYSQFLDIPLEQYLMKHKDTDMRKFKDKEGKYLSRWDLLPL